MNDVFVIMPFGVKAASKEDHKATAINFDFVYKQIIKTACEKAGYNVSRIDEMPTAGIITEQYLKAIIEATIVICDVTLPNGNVYYELGIRQASSPSSTILIAHEGTKLPFDISHQRVFFYNLKTTHRSQIISTLERSLKSAHDTFENPIRKYLENAGLTSNPKVSKIGFEQDLNGRVERAKNSNQLISVWGWAKAFDPLPTFPLLRLAEKLAENKEWKVASEILFFLIKTNNTDYELYRQLGYYLRQQGGINEQEAIQYFERALELNPSDVESLGMLGGIYKRQGNFKTAREYYKRGIEIAPRNLYMRITEAAITFLENPANKDQSIQRYKEILKVLENSEASTFDDWSDIVKAEAFFALGDILQSKKHFLAAMSSEYGKIKIKSAMDQIMLLGKNGLNPELADQLKQWLDKMEKLTEGRQSTSSDGIQSGSENFENLPVIIHLTDVHFGTITKNEKQIDMHRFKEGDYSQTLSNHLKDEFLEYFKYDSARLYLVISGDFTYTATKPEFNAALKFVNEVCQNLKIDKQKVVFTPGNHDIDWHSSKADKKMRFDNYISFLYNFYGNELFKKIYPEIKWDLGVHTDRPEPEHLVSIQVFSADKLVFISLNSCMYETDQNHYGFIGGKQFKTVLKYFKENDINDDFIKIAVTHHHLLPHPVSVNNVGGEVWMDLSIVRDSGLVEYKLENSGFDIVLHGHKHNPQLRETLVRDKNTGRYEKKLIVCGAGSCGVNSGELEHNQANQYQVLELLTMPRVPGVSFIKLVWRELEVYDGSEWHTSKTWVVNG